MNRKQRRALASEKRPGASAGSQQLSRAIELHRHGQLDAAELLYQQAHRSNPRQLDALLGLATDGIARIMLAQRAAIDAPRGGPST